ncbi:MULTISPECIES: guanitoxin biosynthesis L-enduracididine beta-hydroxylase GntD [Amycolatopsis]|uniref:TauD/TfdA family dioxygenase n=1 Tax=Amycolatopsis dendrobii TaxID=2760662 RepID=A0A7W3VRA5_9PSEU|nr:MULTISPECIES: guanitoxin biosynthesis L-enduracididine beta-hydroxylase GntD [Amycolatopsis]MBB1151746.1 TauD/TfdA family dioxygenase [Amycolatopsis dendrobii]UKD58041.1 TauD/TfdA family dioxygenase [Amycolatopsis sp. FU40]
MHLTTADTLARFALTRREVDEIEGLLSRLMSRHDRADNPGFLAAAALHAQELPLRLRSTLGAMRTRETNAACVVSGLPVNDAAIGPTPRHWARQPDRGSTLREELWLVLVASLLGEIFGWATQQNGAVVHDISPSPGHEHTQLGSGSSETLAWHTEEAFHPLRCDYLALLGLRNHDLIPTTFASIGDVTLDSEVRDVLFQPRFRIRPDDSHLAAEDRTAEIPPGREGTLLLAARDRVDQMNSSPQRVAVLSGDPVAPYLAIDPYYMDVPGDDPPARAALDAICRAIDRRLREIVLRPGDIVLIDNFRAVHGRASFRARYDGTDRWFKRVNITRDLRKSRAHRLACDSRVVY